MVTHDVLLIRFVFHEPSSVTISSLSPSGTPHTVVGFGLPSLVKVVSKRYLDRATSSNVSAISLGRLQLDADALLVESPHLHVDTEQPAENAVPLVDRA